MTPAKVGAAKGQFWHDPESLQPQGLRAFSLVTQGLSLGKERGWPQSAGMALGPCCCSPRKITHTCPAQGLLAGWQVARHRVQKHTLHREEVTE